MWIALFSSVAFSRPNLATRMVHPKTAASARIELNKLEEEAMRQAEPRDWMMVKLKAEGFDTLAMPTTPGADHKGTFKSGKTVACTYHIVFEDGPQVDDRGSLHASVSCDAEWTSKETLPDDVAFVCRAPPRPSSPKRTPLWVSGDPIRLVQDDLLEKVEVRDGTHFVSLRDVDGCFGTPGIEMVTKEQPREGL